MNKIFNYNDDYFEPLNVIGNLYFVGTKPASSHIIDTGDGLILLDAGYQHSVHILIDNIYKVGLDVHEIRYIMLTHGHIDHFGATKTLKELTGAKIAIGKNDRDYANGKLDLSYAKELGMEFKETFEPDILLIDGVGLTLGNTMVKAIATPGHTPGAMSYFFDITDEGKTFRTALHGGMGINTLTKEYLDKYGLPYSLRDDFKNSMLKLSKEKVDIFLGNHMQHNNTEEKAQMKKCGNKYAFVDTDEWRRYNLWCIENMSNMIKKEKTK